MQLPCVEAPERLVALEQRRQLRGLLRAIAGKKHPQILNGRAMAGIVQVDDMEGAETSVPPVLRYRRRVRERDALIVGAPPYELHATTSTEVNGRSGDHGRPSVCAVCRPATDAATWLMKFWMMRRPWRELFSGWN